MKKIEIGTVYFLTFFHIKKEPISPSIPEFATSSRVCHFFKTIKSKSY